MTTTTDQRYRLAVFLARSDRPEVVKFHCPRCKNYLCELTGSQMTHLSDAFDPGEGQGIGLRCSGTLSPGQKCRTWFYFTLGDR